jgi:hypothetical protein
MMVVNLANAIRLQGYADGAIAVLEKEDWSATDGVFNVCVGAVRQDIDKLVANMRALGVASDRPSAEEYRN